MYRGKYLQVFKGKLDDLLLSLLRLKIVLIVIMFTYMQRALVCTSLLSLSTFLEFSRWKQANYSARWWHLSDK